MGCFEEKILDANALVCRMPGTISVFPCRRRLSHQAAFFMPGISRGEETKKALLGPGGQEGLKAANAGRILGCRIPGQQHQQVIISILEKNIRQPYFCRILYHVINQ
jgi:hypothetical protein